MRATLAAALLVLALRGARAATLEPLPPAPALDSQEVSLGKSLFFDFRLNGDATTSCAYCHKPEAAFADGIPLSEGYPSTKYFRNSPSLYNTAFKKHLYWDGRFPGGELESVIRDHLSEAHFMQADGRLLVERLRQIPGYLRSFEKVYGRQPDYGGLLDALSAYVRSLTLKDAPLDRYLRGDKTALGQSARRGMELFTGKADCVRCHNGPLLTDGKFHNRHVPEHPENLKAPRRQITFRRFLRILGVENYKSIKRDPGLFAVTKIPADIGKFKTPSLWNVERTGPYMHNGVIETLEDAAAFEAPGLDVEELADLTEFLKSLTSPKDPLSPPEVPRYEVRPLRKTRGVFRPSRAPAPSAPKKRAPIGPLPPVPVPEDNPPTPEKLRLGRMLFFDTRISGNRENACSTCHNPEMGWGDGYDIAHGYLGTQHWRNSQTLFNVGYYSKLNWDGQRTSLEDQARSAVLSNISANGDPQMIEERLAQAPIYLSLFKAVFGTERPHFEDLIKAIAAFVRSAAISRNAPFDAYARGNEQALGRSALRGMGIFKGKGGCVQCHNGPLFTDEDYHATGAPDNPAFTRDHLKQVTFRYKLASNGVPEDFYRTAPRDPGLYIVTKRTGDIGRFRTASLRELKHTPPYMHNGVFATLEEVVDFYDRGGGKTPNKSPLIQPLHLTPGNKKDLLAFLKSLSGDPVIVEAPELPGYPGATHK